MTVAILFARADSYYKTLPDMDVYDMARDARSWPGGVVGVYHPPCRAWGQLSHMANPRPDEKDLARWSVKMIRQFGGVLEHPAKSKLWADQQLPPVGQVDEFGGWTLPIHQNWWGHKAEKATLLYIVGCSHHDLPEIPMKLGRATHVIASSTERQRRGHPDFRPEVTKAEREHTPPALAEWLVETAPPLRKGSRMISTKPPKEKACRVCRSLFTPQRMGAKVCSAFCAMTFAKSVRAKAEKVAQVKERREDKAKLQTLKSLSELAKEAEREVNRYVRLRDAHEGCASCDKPASWDGQWHASHFRSVGAAPGLRFHLWNIHKACSICNNHLSGNIVEYTPRLIVKIGADRVEWLRNQNQVVKRGREYLIRVKAVFRRKANRQETRNAKA